MHIVENNPKSPIQKLAWSSINHILKAHLFGKESFFMSYQETIINNPTYSRLMLKTPGGLQCVIDIACVPQFWIELNASPIFESYASSSLCHSLRPIILPSCCHISPVCNSRNIKS